MSQETTTLHMLAEEMLPGIEPFPFTKVIWHSVDAKEEWERIVERSRSLHDQAEYEMVRQGYRRCATVHISPWNYDEMMERIISDGLVWLPMVRTKNYGGFSHKHYPTHPGDPDSSVYGVLARTLDDAEAFREATRGNGSGSDHITIGELLGFPRCCAEKFNEWWPTYIDPVYQAAEISEHTVFETENYSGLKVTPHIATQQMLRYAGFRLCSHFPCSLECEASIEVGRAWREVMRSIDPKAYEYFERVMTLPGEWSCLHGIAQVETPHFTIVTNSMPTKGKWVVRWDEVKGYE